MSPDFQTRQPPADDRPDWWTSDEWATPPEFVAALEAEFGVFTLDPCARAETAKAEYYYTQEDNGLVQPWEGQVFVNPPYSNPAPWVQKAIAEAPRATTILLLPAATDVGWFHDLVVPHCNVRFVRGRLRFLGWHGRPVGSPTAGSMIARVPKCSLATLPKQTRFHL